MARTRNASSGSEPAPRRRQVAAERAHAALLRYILDHPDATCKSAAEGLGMSFPNVCRVVAGFRDRGLVVGREHKQTGKRGPWSQVLALAPHLGATIGVDLEATQVRGVLLDFANNVIETVRRPVPASAGPPEIVALVAETAGSLAELNRKTRGGPGAAAGLALPGPITDARLGRIRTFLQFGEAEIEFAPAAQRAAGVPTFSTSNTYCFAVGHHRLTHPGRPGIDLVILDRFGIGAAALWDGRLFSGADDYAGDLGLLRCGTGEPGRRFVDVCTGASLLARERTRGGTRGLWDLLQAPEDPVVTEWLAGAVPAFAEAVAIGLVMYNPDRILIEGIFNRLPVGIRDRITGLATDEAVKLGHKPPKIEFFAGDDLFGARGAALLARDAVADAAVLDILRTARGG